MPLSTLPNEILYNIFSYLGWSDVKNVRAQDRRLAEIGLEYFPREITIVATDWRSLERVEKLVSLGPVGKNVRFVSICCYVRFPNLPGPGSTVTTAFGSVLKDILDRHCNSVQEGTYSAAIKAILQKLHRLESVVIPYDYHQTYNVVVTQAVYDQLPGNHEDYTTKLLKCKKGLLKQVMNAVLLRFSELSLQQQKPKRSLEYTYTHNEIEEKDTISLHAGLKSLTHLN